MRTDSSIVHSSLDRCIDEMSSQYALDVASCLLDTLGIHVFATASDSSRLSRAVVLDGKNWFALSSSSHQSTCTDELDISIDYGIEASIWKCWPSTKALLRDLLVETRNFISVKDGLKLSNPYFGCQSIEEAFIKRDLLTS